MEGEGNSCSSLPDVTEQGLQQDSWTSIDHQYVDGNQQGLVLEETEVQINQELSTDQMGLSLKTDRDSPEEPEPWEQIIWPVHPVTCTSPLLSFATVQWDMPDPSAGTSLPVTHGSLANELDSVIMTRVGTTSPSPHLYEDVNDELFREEDRETEEEFNFEPLNGNVFEPCDDVNVQEHTPQEEEDSAQEQLGSNNENVQEILLRIDPEKEEKEEEVESASSDPVESLVIINSLQEIEGSEDEVDSFVDLKLEEEREESVALLSRQRDSEEEETSLNGVETEKKDKEESKLEEEEEQGEVEEDKESGEVEEEKEQDKNAERDEVEEDAGRDEAEQDEVEEDEKQDEVEEDAERDKVEEDEERDKVEEDTERDEVEEDEAEQDKVEEDAELDEVEEDEEGERLNRCTGESEALEADGCLNHVEVPAEPQQTDETGLTIIPDKLLALQLSEFSEEKGQSEAEKDTELQEEGPTGQTEELEMCRDVDQDVEPEQSEAADNIEERSTQAADNIERVEDIEEILELTEKLQETSYSPHQECQKTTSQDKEESTQLKRTASEQFEMIEGTEQVQKEKQNSEDKVEESEHLEQSLMELADESTQTEKAEESTPSEQTPSAKAEDPVVTEQREQTEPSDQNGQQTANKQLMQSEKTDESDIMEQLSSEAEVTQQTEKAEFNQQDKQAETSPQAEEDDKGVKDNVQTVVSNGVQHKCPDTAVPHMNGGEVDRESARSLAERLFKLDGVQRVEVVRHLDKDNDYSRAVGEEYLKLFDFTGQTLDHALRSFLKVVVLIGETQERERVLQHFACRFHQCNPDSFSSAGSVLALTCALMLLNTDLHGQNVGKSMSSSKFVSNLDGMNEGANFSKDFLKSLYNSIKSEPLEWAVDEEELKSSVLVDEDAGDDTLLRSKANPFQDVPHNKTAAVIKQGFLQRKLHADVDGKRIPWGKRGWKTFYAVLRGMVLYLQKDDYRKDQLTNEEVVSVHHSVAEEAADYTKKPHVLRLQTADWRVFLFQASSRAEMNSWISRINLVSALHSSPPFPAAVGSQRRFCRPILPSSQSAHTLESQLQSHAKMLESFQADLLYLQQNLPEGKKAKAKELEEQRVRAEYLQHEICRYQIYIQVLEAWKKVKTTDDGMLTTADLNLFDRAVCADSVGEVEEEGGLVKSHSSPSLELEMPAPTVIKVRRNISERRTYRRTIVPRWNKEA